MDPCTPRGYASEKESRKLSHTSLMGKKKFKSTLYPSGNFSECRSASLKLLQKGQGIYLITPHASCCVIVHDIILCSEC